MGKGIDKRKHRTVLLMARCKVCKEKFEPKFFNQKSCFNPKCVIEQSQRVKKVTWKKNKRELKEKLKTNSDYRKDLQKEVNYFVRQRDKDKSCISCPKPLKQKFDAGHYRSVGNCPDIIQSPSCLDYS